MSSPRLPVIAAGLAALGAHAFAQTSPAPATSPTPAPSSTAAAAPASATAASFKDAFTQGKLSANARVRYEAVDQESLQDAESLNARLRLGFTTKEYRGFQAMLEGEAVAQIAGDSYDGTGTNTTPPTATIADPENYEINQAWVSYAFETALLRLGRQRIVLDNARFIGDVGWRQNQQTFDAAFVQDKSFKHTTLTYGYLDRINRVFDDSAPQYDWASDSHILNASFNGFSFGTLTGYGYLLDFNDTDQGANAYNNSSQTYGLSFAGSRPVAERLKALYRLEYATQTDYGSSLLDYRSDYYTVELGGAFKPVTLVAAYEVLGSDDSKAGSGFKTPLATLHSHNGWADKFLVTPDAGLEDLNLKATVELPADLTALARYHWFSASEGDRDYGTELDLQLTYKFDARLSFTAKAAFYTADDSPAPAGPLTQDTDKFWLQADYAY